MSDGSSSFSIEDDAKTTLIGRFGRVDTGEKAWPIRGVETGQPPGPPMGIDKDKDKDDDKDKEIEMDPFPLIENEIEIENRLKYYELIPGVPKKPKTIYQSWCWKINKEATKRNQELRDAQLAAEQAQATAAQAKYDKLVAAKEKRELVMKEKREVVLKATKRVSAAKAHAKATSTSSSSASSSAKRTSKHP